MKPTTRRRFLKRTSTGLLMAAAAPHGFNPGAAAASATPTARRIPLHRALDLPGVHGYADRESVFAGDTLQFHISCTTPYQVSIHRLGHDPDSPSQDTLLHTFPRTQPTPQAIHPGSHIHVAKNLKGPLTAITLECWVRPWNLSRLQGVISQEDKEDERGLALGIGKGGYIGFFLGDGVSPDDAVIHRTHEGAVALHRWHHLVARWDGAVKEVWVDGRLEGQWPFRGVCDPGPHPIRIGAMGEKGAVTRFLDGDVAMPAIYLRALAPEEIRDRYNAKALRPPTGPGIAGCWPLNEEQGEQVADASPAERRGRIINSGTWMIGGPSFDGTQVPRFEPYSPAADPRRGHGLRLAADDLFDCRWQPTHAWRVPRAMEAGIYVARIRTEPQASATDYSITFIVRRARLRRRPPLLVVCSTSTWRAYNSVPFGEIIPAGFQLDTTGYVNTHPEAPAYSCYRDHHSGQPSYQFGFRMPWPSASPYILYSSKATGYSHLMRAERFLHIWLEQAGYAFDLATDYEVHSEPSRLRGYKTVILNGHSEYWSAEACRALDSYLAAGGTSVVFSGNTLFWRTSFSRDGAVMECRKYDERIGGRHAATVGELYHSQDGLRGSLLRECGLPAWSIIGLDCCGWNGVEAEQAGVYHVTNARHPLFHFPEETGLKDGATFGHSPDGKSHKAVGHEFDVRLGTLLHMTPFLPPGFPTPAEPAGIVTLAEGKRPDHAALDYLTLPTRSPEGVLAEMIYWKRPQGGRVFHAGAIGAGWALSVDPSFQALFRNVLHDFGIPRPGQRAH